jgi:hypothetical protein
VTVDLIIVRYIAHRFPRPSELREYWRLMRAERVEIVVQVNDSVEGGAYWKSKDVKILEESHIVPKPQSIEYITLRKLEVRNFPEISSPN